jgi:hypothetical protein
MACMTVCAPAMAMATTQLARVVRYEAADAWYSEPSMDRRSLRLNWVVVTGNNGGRQLRAQWLPADGGQSALGH